MGGLIARSTEKGVQTMGKRNASPRCKAEDPRITDAENFSRIFFIVEGGFLHNIRVFRGVQPLPIVYTG
jgi:hypothetical protein